MGEKKRQGNEKGKKILSGENDKNNYTAREGARVHFLFVKQFLALINPVAIMDVFVMLVYYSNKLIVYVSQLTLQILKIIK